MRFLRLYLLIDKNKGNDDKRETNIECVRFNLFVLFYYCIFSMIRKIISWPKVSSWELVRKLFMSIKKRKSWFLYQLALWFLNVISNRFIIELSRTMLVVKLSKWLMLLRKNTWAEKRNKISKSISFFFVATNISWVVTQRSLMSNSALILSISIVGQILKMMLNVCLEKMEAAIIYVCTYFILSYYPKNEVCLCWIQRVSKVFGKLSYIMGVN